ncbi:MAG TPA: PepSY domain-containing protein [Burkholderiales bacterium]|nr:PepSY domain-containing protein [Betaproteobacteria bacterium]HQR53601.1 PepSY domain-containing protein [Burkholderiales bacterium]
MRKRRALAAALLASALAAGTAHAADGNTGGGTTPAITITQAIAAAEAQANGRAVEAELERGARGIYYEVKVVGADGVREIHVDATDGKVLAVQQKSRLTSWLDDDDDDDDDD